MKHQTELIITSNEISNFNDIVLYCLNEFVQFVVCNEYSPHYRISSLVLCCFIIAQAHIIHSSRSCSDSMDFRNQDVY